MFTGLVQERGIVTTIVRAETSAQITIKAPLLAPQIKTGDSVSVDGVCLTATAVTADSFTADAMVQTLAITSLGKINQGSEVNLELAARLDARMGGHIVQGHVDLTGFCTEIKDQQGSWEYRFTYPLSSGHVTVEKGSICVNGTSLTVVDSQADSFSVCIIPYTFEHTVFHQLQVGDRVNLEFDILGKYMQKLLARQLAQ